MFPLRTHSLPSNAVALQQALEDSLKQVVQPASPMVAIKDLNFPKLSAIRLTLDNAVALDRIPPRPSPQTRTREPALQVEHLEISGRPVRVHETAINFFSTASEVAIYQGRDPEGNLLLFLQRAAEGRVEVALRLRDLERLIGAVAKSAAARQGVVVENVRLAMRAQTERALDLEISLEVRKLFLRTKLRVKGRLDIEDNLDARVSGLECTGEGTLGTLACGFLDSHLRGFNDRRFSLLSLPLSEIKLRRIRLAVDENLHLTAEFGREASPPA